MKGPEWQKKHLSIAEAAKELGRWLGYLYGFLFHKKGLFLTPKPSGVDNMLGFLSRMCPFSEPSRPIVILGVAAALTAFFNTLPGPGFAGQRLLLSLLYGRVSDDMFPLIKTITAAIILIIVIAMWVILFIKDVTLF
jgi:Zn-dependent protease